MGADSAIQDGLQWLAGQQLAGFFLIIARLTPLFIVAPLFSSKLVPRQVRVIILVALGVFLTPLIAGEARIPTGVAELAGLLLKELLIGFTFAYILSALFAGVAAAGSFLDTLIGFSFGSLVDPVNGTQTTVLSQFYSMMAVLIFIVIGGDAWVIQGLVQTYAVVGLTETPSFTAMIQGADQAFVSIFVSAVEIAGPVMLSLILADVAFGMVSRLAPQLNVFIVGFPVKVIVGLAVIGVSLPFVGGWLDGQIQESVSQALRAIQLA